MSANTTALQIRALLAALPDDLERAEALVGAGVCMECGRQHGEFYDRRGFFSCACADGPKTTAATARPVPANPIVDEPAKRRCRHCRGIFDKWLARCPQCDSPELERRTFHTAVSVDIDRFSDPNLELAWLDLFRDHGCNTAEDIRALCRTARAAGLVVFPACSDHKPDGTCPGHESTD